jgi:hypothetical protein
MTDQFENIIQLVEERGEFVMAEDGYIVYWPTTEPVKHPSGGTTGGGGFYPSYVLRAIADELDKRNAVWDAQVRADLERLERLRPLGTDDAEFGCLP